VASEKTSQRFQAFRIVVWQSVLKSSRFGKPQFFLSSFDDPLASIQSLSSTVHHWEMKLKPKAFTLRSKIVELLRPSNLNPTN